MRDVSDLHWSVDYTAQTDHWDVRSELSQPLSEALSSPSVDPNASPKTHGYTILPNFWCGYNPDETHSARFSIGSLLVERTLAESGWRYRVIHDNTPSGERLTLDFTCGDEPLRPLRSPWRILAHNDADGVYSEVDWKGSIEGATISLTTSRGLSFEAGEVPPGTPLTTIWALVDVLPTLTGGADGFSILEDLETLKPGCRIHPLETWTFESHTLTGHVLSGEGLPPSYWWLTESGDVALVSTIFSTYVLCERGT